MAPERFSKSDDQRDPKYLSPAMDIFSLGCVIAEIFLGHRLFDLAMLQNYRKGVISLNDLIKSNKPEDKEAIDLIKNMLELDPS